MNRVFVLSALFAVLLVSSGLAQAQQGAPLPAPPSDGSLGAPLPAPPQAAPDYPPQELDRIVSPIALYPDPLLGQVLTAATFSPEIPDAARWADQHHYVAPLQLPAVIAADRLPWQPSVQALLPFPQVLNMMASDMPWTEELGAAFLESPDQVMDAVQRRRLEAADYGYLRSNAQIIVRRGPSSIEILPVDPAYMVVPYYDPAVVFIPPRRGVLVGGAIRFGYGVRLGVAYAPWGWGTTRFAWGEHRLIVNNAPWDRRWANRAAYVHPFPAVPRYVERRPDERHVSRERSEREREAERRGRHSVEEHRGDEKHRRDNDRR
jgi:hypothetical protein